MYIPPAFEEHDATFVRAVMRAAGLAHLVLASADGPLSTPLPLFLDERDGAHGTLLGHVARANPIWRAQPLGEALAIFGGPDAYVSPSWYASKRDSGKVVPTWNYVTVHAFGPVEFFSDADRLLDVVTRLTSMHEDGRAHPWAVSDAPPDYIDAMLRGIVGVRIPVTRLACKRKMSQNRSEQDRAGVIAGLEAGTDPTLHAVAGLIKK